MKPIVTLTLNSSVDVQWAVPEMVHTHKLRSSPGLSFPGGGGINVSRVLKALGGQSICVYTAGSFTGHFLREMINSIGIVTRVVPISADTRASATIFDESSGLEYRVTPPGPRLEEKEWQACLDALFDIDADYIVATGSLPGGVPEDLYARVASRATDRGTRVILDTSGAALASALEAGVFLVKPNLAELSHLTGVDVAAADAQDAAVNKLVDDGKADVVALTLGGDGALLATKSGTLRQSCPDVKVKSAVGAGDSFLAGMTYGLANGQALEDAFALGLATGSATVLTEGSELCRRSDVERLFYEITNKRLSA